MIEKKILAIVITLLLVTAITSTLIIESFFLNNSPSDEAPHISAYPTSLENSENPLIEGVPYIDQEMDFFCHYAACTMIFQYFDIDTTLHEVLYYSGVGYSQAHQSSIPLPMGGYGISQGPDDIDFLATLYGLSFNIWYPNNNILSDDECWYQYWSYVKQNISNNIPVITSVDPFILPSLRQQFDVPENIWDKFSAGGHGIVVLGYNESNGTVCYNDPAAEYFGDAGYGTYAWMKLVDFREAVTRTLGTKYVILSFEKISDPLLKNEAFEIAHERNIERLKGNIGAYDKTFSKVDDLKFGISASKALKDDFARGIKHRIKTIFLYKYIGMQFRRQNRRNIVYSFLWNIPQSFLKSFNPKESEYGRIAIEKRYTADYLKNVNTLPEYSDEATLFEQEAEYWDTLAFHYDKFLNRGFFITSLCAIWIIRTMGNVVNDVISTEETIIASST